MNATSKTFFQNNLRNFQQEYEESKKTLNKYVEEKGIKSHNLGDAEYYQLCIKKWRKYRQIKMVEAILQNREYSFINQETPVIDNKITFCERCLEEVRG